jgi:hypothetical protein
MSQQEPETPQQPEVSLQIENTELTARHIARKGVSADEPLKAVKGLPEGTVLSRRKGLPEDETQQQAPSPGGPENRGYKSRLILDAPDEKQPQTQIPMIPTAYAQEKIQEAVQSSFLIGFVTGGIIIGGVYFLWSAMKPKEIKEAVEVAAEVLSSN